VQHFAFCGKEWDVRAADDTSEQPVARPTVDAGVFQSLYAEHAGGLFRYFARRVGRDLAEDLLAETFHTAIKAYNSFDTGRGGEREWLFGIGSNLLSHHWRSEQRRLLALARDAAAPATSVDPLLAVGDFVADCLDARHVAERVIGALGELSPDDRTLLFLSGWEHMSSGEIAAVVGAPAATVRSRLRRLRQQLRSVAAIDPTPRENEK
jgi:RNA polymerase sigma factor (sigma-70 family)